MLLLGGRGNLKNKDSAADWVQRASWIRHVRNMPVSDPIYGVFCWECGYPAMVFMDRPLCMEHSKQQNQIIATSDTEFYSTISSPR